jgi:hypothetical protein
LINGNSPVSHCSKCEAEPGDGRAWLCDQDQAARHGTRRKSECRIVLERGQKSREKVIRIEGLSEEEVRCRLLATI